MRPLNEIIVHCTATPPEWMQNQSAAAKRDEVWRWHVEERGWRDIGYHYLIDRDGTVIEGRPLDQVGAHVRGHNRGSIGISLIGGFGGEKLQQFSDNFTDEQDASLRVLIGDLQRDRGPMKLSGHSEYANKACPCFDVRAWHGGKPARQSPAQSTTIQAAAGAGLAGAGGVFTALSQLDPIAQGIVLGFAAVALLGLGYIARERLRKWAAGDR